MRLKVERQAAELMEQKANESKDNCMEEKMRELEQERDALWADYMEEQQLRKKYYNEIEELKGKIRVFLRIRPLSTSEKMSPWDQKTP